MLDVIERDNSMPLNIRKLASLVRSFLDIFDMFNLTIKTFDFLQVVLQGIKFFLNRAF